jgi:hypothetical protein
MAMTHIYTEANPGAAPGASHAGGPSAGSAPQGEARDEARRLADEAQRRGAALFEGQRHAAADEIGGMAGALRKAASQLDAERRPSTASLAGRAADSLDRLASGLREHDLRALAGQAEGYARQHPGLFFAGSVAAGLLLARLLKSSAEHPGTGRPGAVH